MSTGNGSATKEMGGRVEVMEITPEVARQLLERGGQNRPIKRKVSHYAREMAEGRWILNGSTIVLNEQGEVLDGQHRLLACIEAGISFQTVVVYDVPRSAFVTIDAGMPRSLADDLAVEGVVNYTTIAAGLGWVWLYDKGNINLNQRPTGDQRGTRAGLLAFYRKCSAPAWQRAAKAGQEAAKLVGSAGIGAGCHFIFQRKSASAADDFFRRLLEGELTDEGSPFPSLRRRLMKDRYEDRMNRMNPGAKIALILKAWNAFISGAKVKQLRLSPSDKDVFPAAIVTRKPEIDHDDVRH